jgi:predicted metal-dependent hydrolase
MLATALYHERRGNKDGAAKMYSGALERLNKDTLYRYGIEAKTLLEAIRERIALPGNEFGDMDIELCDGTLAWMCHKETVKHGSKWGIASDLSDERLIHRHRYKKQK